MKFSIFNKKEKTKEPEEKSNTRAIVILIAFAVIVLGYNIYQLIFGTPEQKTALISFFKSNFHINRIDLGIILILGIVMIILKLKKGKK